MFVFLSKFLPQFIYPVGLSVILLFTGLFFLKRPKILKYLLITVILLLWIAGNRWVASALARSLEWQYLTPKEIPNSEVIILLGGGTEPQQYPRPTVEANGSIDRVMYAAYLYKQGKASHILLSGGSIDWLDARASSTPAGEMKTILLWLGIPDSAIWLESESRNTFENAVFTKAMLEQKGIKRAILVTSAFHMPRSVLLFQKAGVDVIPAPTDYSITKDEWEELTTLNPVTILLNLLPGPGNLSMTTNALKEYIGMFTYRLRGWL